MRFNYQRLVFFSFCRPQSSFLEPKTTNLIHNETPLGGDWQHLWIQVRDCTTGKLNAFIEKAHFGTMPQKCE